MAERVGFEPTVRFPVRSLSRRVLSTAQSPLRGRVVESIVTDRSRPQQRDRALPFRDLVLSKNEIGRTRLPGRVGTSSARRYG